MNLCFLEAKKFNKYKVLFFSGMLNNILCYAEISIFNDGRFYFICRSSYKYISYIMVNEIYNLCP